MAKVLQKIVLTGGPCGGKTTAMAEIEQSLSEKGFRVFIIAESATELINGNLKPFGEDKVDNFIFQIANFKNQLSKEQIYEEAIAALPDNEKCVLLCDRGIMDNKAYVSSEEFKELEQLLGLSRIESLDRYDKVIHMVTAANGAEEYYTLENNEARSEGVELAKELDARIADAWNGHADITFADNSTDFKTKVNKVVAVIENSVGVKPERIQHKYIVEPNEMVDIFSDIDVVEIDLEQYYLKPNDRNYYKEYRLRKRSINGKNSYYLTIQHKKEDGLSVIATHKIISKKEFYDMLDSGEVISSVHKKRYCFNDNHQYYRLDFFTDHDLMMLEVDAVPAETINIPKGLNVVQEVTGDLNYNNFNLGKHKVAERKII